MTAARLSALALAGCLALAQLSPAAQPSLYDAALYAKASQALAAGDLEGAMRGYCDMLSVRGPGTLWTLSAVLLCDPAEVRPYVATIQGIQPVFVQARLYQGKWCYRICAGLTGDKNEAFRWRALLPARLLAEGPFPVPVTLPCSKPSAPESEIAAAPKAGTPTAPATPPAAPSPAAPPPPRLTPEAAAKATPAAIAEPSKAKRAEGEAWFQKGLSAQGQGRRSDAEEDYKRALEADPDRPEVLNNLGVLYLQQDRFEDAKALFSKAIARSPSYARAHLNLAGALWGLQDREGALMEAREAVALDPGDVSAHLTLASFLLAQGQKAEAAEQARRVLLLDPGNAQAKVFLTTSTGNTPEAPKP